MATENLFPVDSDGSVSVKREAPQSDEDDADEATVTSKKKKAKKVSDGTKKTGGEYWIL